MCSYFIDYCEYSNSVKGYGSKASRYSESATFFEQLSCAFYILTLIGIFIVLFVHHGGWHYLIAYTVLGGIFTGRAYQCRLNWAKTVLSKILKVLTIQLSYNLCSSGKIMSLMWRKDNLTR